MITEKSIVQSRTFYIPEAAPEYSIWKMLKIQRIRFGKCSQL